MNDFGICGTITRFDSLPRRTVAGMSSAECRFYAETVIHNARPPRVLKAWAAIGDRGARMNYRRHQTEPGTERRPQPNGPGRRGFLRQAGLAAIVVGGLETVGISRAMAATTTRKRSIVPPSKNVGAVYPRTGRPGPDTKSIGANPGNSSDVTWYCSPGNCGSGCPDQEQCYFWYDSGNGEYGGPVCAWSNGTAHAQRV
jgi:hypothetical protein